MNQNNNNVENKDKSLLYGGVAAAIFIVAFGILYLVFDWGGKKQEKMDAPHEKSEQTEPAHAKKEKTKSMLECHTEIANLVETLQAKARQQRRLRRELEKEADQARRQEKQKKVDEHRMEYEKIKQKYQELNDDFQKKFKKEENKPSKEVLEECINKTLQEVTEEFEEARRKLHEASDKDKAEKRKAFDSSQLAVAYVIHREREKSPEIADRKTFEKFIKEEELSGDILGVGHQGEFDPEAVIGLLLPSEQDAAAGNKDDGTNQKEGTPSTGDEFELPAEYVEILQKMFDQSRPFFQRLSADEKKTLEEQDLKQLYLEERQAHEAYEEGGDDLDKNQETLAAARSSLFVKIAYEASKQQGEQVPEGAGEKGHQSSSRKHSLG